MANGAVGIKDAKYWVTTWIMKDGKHILVRQEYDDTYSFAEVVAMLYRNTWDSPRVCAFTVQAEDHHLAVAVRDCADG